MRHQGACAMFAMLFLACGDNHATDDAMPSGDAKRVDIDARVDSRVIDAPVVDAAAIDPCVLHWPPPTLICPTPSLGKMTLCGSIRDAELTTTIAISGADGSACDPTQPTNTGPCSLSVTVYDAQEYVADPAGAAPLVTGAQTIDNCGRYSVPDVTLPASGFAAIVVRDHPSLATARVIPTWIVAWTLPGYIGPWGAYTTRIASDQVWSTSAALSPGFGEHGAILFRFSGACDPDSSIRVIRDGDQIPDDDFYFSDAYPQRTTIDPARSAVGPNLSALVIGGPASATYSGLGGGNAWRSTTATALPGRIHVADIGRSTNCP